MKTTDPDTGKVFDWDSGMIEVKYPDVEVELVGEDGNAMAIMGRVSGALRRAGVPQDEVSEYMRESMKGDYDELLRTAMRWVNVT